MKTVFFDVDTQFDFVSPAGALYVPGAEQILETIGKLNRFAMSAGHPLISTVDAHPENDPEFAAWPPHCIAGTFGQHKPTVTLAGQIIFEKVTTDLFLNSKITALLSELGADRYVVYGVVTEVCVRFAALGLLKTGAKVEVVTDAIRQLQDPAMEQFFAELHSAGGTLTTSSALLTS